MQGRDAAVVVRLSSWVHSCRLLWLPFETSISLWECSVPNLRSAILLPSYPLLLLLLLASCRCQPLVVGYKFLFPFEARRRFFYCTSFGLARALTYLQQVWLGMYRTNVCSGMTYLYLEHIIMLQILPA